mmetsp:Transcript_11676/g.37337  ORF Transcript_11676/g.37337 Transcript_11676/m.37337 type:complete len:246 (-) Transcript_11676:76-813(-)
MAVMPSASAPEAPRVEGSAPTGLGPAAAAAATAAFLRRSPGESPSGPGNGRGGAGSTSGIPRWNCCTETPCGCFPIGAPGGGGRGLEVAKSPTPLSAASTAKTSRAERVAGSDGTAGAGGGSDRGSGGAGAAAASGAGKDFGTRWWLAASSPARAARRAAAAVSLTPSSGPTSRNSCEEATTEEAMESLAWVRKASWPIRTAGLFGTGEGEAIRSMPLMSSRKPCPSGLSSRPSLSSVWSRGASP